MKLSRLLAIVTAAVFLFYASGLLTLFVHASQEASDEQLRTFSAQRKFEGCQADIELANRQILALTKERDLLKKELDKLKAKPESAEASKP